LRNARLSAIDARNCELMISVSGIEPLPFHVWAPGIWCHHAGQARRQCSGEQDCYTPCAVFGQCLWAKKKEPPYGSSVFLLLDSFLKCVKLITSDDGKSVFLQHFNSLFRSVESEYEHRTVSTLLDKCIHVLNVDSLILEHG